MGASGQGICWEDDFCRQLVDSERFVIRFDNRDTGLTTCFDFEKQPYTLMDMAADAVGILDAYGLESAHVVGISMGGMIGQVLAIEQPRRIRSLTSIISSPVTSITSGDTGLPPPSPEFIAKMLALSSESPATSRDDYIEDYVTGTEMLAGSLEPFDREAMRRIGALEVDRATHYAARSNHGLAIESTEPGDRRLQLRKLDVPTLVIHGAEDPILALPHGVATAEAIPGAKLLTIEKLGHEMPRSAWPAVIPAILDHTR